MTLRLTPEVLEHCYNMLQATAPFSRWGLPASDQIVFRVVHGVACSPYIWAQHLSHKQRKAHPAPGHHLIDINALRIRQLGSLVVTMAHEMTHVYESMISDYKGEAHGALFNQLADRVCRHHGFDRGTF